MIVTPKHEADFILRFIVFVRPAIIWFSLITAFCGAVHIHNKRWIEGIFHLIATVLAWLMYLVTENDWKKQK